MSLGEALYAIVLYPIVQVIEVAYKIFSQLFSNTGIAIMGVSFVVTVLCLPLYIVAEKWQQLERDTQRRLKPGVDRIKAAFKGDEQYMILSTYYRQNHYHPMMALRSSFGLLIQVPFFMAAYSCLSSLPALQGQSFLFIRDMGAPDALFSVGGFAVNVLPIAMTVINIVAGMIYTKGFPFKEKAQIYGMALLFLVLLYNSPAGLVLYWTMNNVFSLVKNIFYKLRHPVKVLYILMCAGIILADIYILFVYGGSASMTKRLAAVVPFTCLVFVPYLVRGVNWLLDNKVSNLVNTPPPIKLRIFIPVAVAWALLSGLVLPSSLIASSVSEFSDIGSSGNPAVFLWYSCFQSLGLFVFWPLCIFFLFKERIQTLLTIAFSMGFVCSVVNAFLFVVNYGAMDITLTFEGGLKGVGIGYTLANICVMAGVCTLVFLLLAKNGRKLLSSSAVIGVLAFIAFGGLNVRAIGQGYAKYQELKQRNAIAIDGMEPVFNFTKTGKNVVVIMLDRAESAYLEALVEDYPRFQEMFSGFVYFKNALAYNGSTLIGAPGLYGGYEYTPFEMNSKPELSLKEKHNQSLLVMPRVFTEAANFSVVMTDTSWGNYSYEADLSFVEAYPDISAKNLQGVYTSYYLKGTHIKTLSSSVEQGITRNLLWTSFFREFPIMLRPAIYYRGTYYNSKIVEYSNNFFDWYSCLAVLPVITSFTSSQDSFILMTNEVTHTTIGNDEISLTGDTLLSHTDIHYKENFLALNALGEWFALLKSHGVYDNTRIIIVSDHGIGQGEREQELFSTFKLNDESGYSKNSFRSLLLYKDFDAQGEILTDMTFMTTADVPILSLEGIVDNPVNPFTGNQLDASGKSSGVFVTTGGRDGLWMPEHSKSEYIFTVPDDSWYHVKDNIFIDSNWTQEVPR